MKKRICVIPMLVLVCFAAGCQDRAAIKDQNKALATRFVDAYQKGDIATIRNICSPDFIEHGLGQVFTLKRLNLSVSLNAPDDELRGELMPVNRAAGLEALAAALALYPQRRNFALAVNYCLIPGRNDGPGAEDGVAAFLRAAAPSGRAVVNLIPYNPGSAPIGRSPTEAETEGFIRRLQAAGAPVKLRSPRGRGLMAACGQLGPTVT